VKFGQCNGVLIVNGYCRNYLKFAKRYFVLFYKNFFSTSELMIILVHSDPSKTIVFAASYFVVEIVWHIFLRSFSRRCNKHSLLLTELLACFSRYFVKLFSRVLIETHKSLIVFLGYLLDISYLCTVSCIVIVIIFFQLCVVLVY